VNSLFKFCTGTICHRASGRRRTLATVLGCLTALLVLAQVGGVFHELSHLQGDQHGVPGHSPVKAACDECGAFAALGAPLGMPPPPASIAQPEAREFSLPILPEPPVLGVTVHNRDPPAPAPLALIT
jgi:hypothetical protein